MIVPGNLAKHEPVGNHPVNELGQGHRREESGTGRPELPTRVLGVDVSEPGTAMLTHIKAVTKRRDA